MSHFLGLSIINLRNMIDIFIVMTVYALCAIILFLLFFLGVYLYCKIRNYIRKRYEGHPKPRLFLFTAAIIIAWLGITIACSMGQSPLLTRMY